LFILIMPSHNEYDALSPRDALPISNKEIPVKFFKLRDRVGGYSKIEVEIKVGDNNYAYGVKFNKKIISEEWLYQINKRTEKKILDRKSTRLNSSHVKISYAVFCSTK